MMEVPFHKLQEMKTSVKNAVDFILKHQKYNVFVMINLYLYALSATLIILRIFWIV